MCETNILYGNKQAENWLDREGRVNEAGSYYGMTFYKNTAKKEKLNHLLEFLPHVNLKQKI